MGTGEQAMKSMVGSRFSWVRWSALALAAWWAMPCQAVIVTVSLWKTMINNQPRYLILCMDTHIGDTEQKVVTRERQGYVNLGKELGSVQFIVEDLVTYEGDDEAVKKYNDRWVRNVERVYEETIAYLKKSGHTLSLEERQKILVEAMMGRSSLAGLAQLLKNNDIAVYNAEMRHQKSAFMQSAGAQRELFREKLRDMLKAEQARLIMFARKQQEKKEKESEAIGDYILTTINTADARLLLEKLSTLATSLDPKQYTTDLNTYTSKILEARMLESIVTAYADGTQYAFVAAGKDHLRALEEILPTIGYRMVDEIKGTAVRGRSESVVYQEALANKINAVRFCYEVIGCSVNLEVVIKGLLEKARAEDKVVQEQESP